jgi:hypothetical protein
MGHAMSTWYRWILLGGGLLAATIAVASAMSSPAVPITLASKESTEISPSPTPSVEQQLQIEQLRQETSWEGRLQGYLPAGSALAALAAAGWGVFVYLRDQRRDLQLRTQMEIGNNLNRLIEHDKGEAIKSGRIISALTTLNSLANQSANKDKLLRDVTSIMTAAIMEDIDFSNVGQVRFEVLCLRNWAPYEAHLRDNPDERGYILYRYLSALHELRGRQENYVPKVNWNKESMKYVHPLKLIMEPEDDFLLFQRLADGIRTHWLLIDDESRRATLAKDFQAATGNPELTLQLLKGATSS